MLWGTGHNIGWPYWIITSLLIIIITILYLISYILYIRLLLIIIRFSIICISFQFNIIIIFVIKFNFSINKCSLSFFIINYYCIIIHTLLIYVVIIAHILGTLTLLMVIYIIIRLSITTCYMCSHFIMGSIIINIHFIFNICIMSQIWYLSSMINCIFRLFSIVIGSI